jgi:hypothetical protein
MPTVSGIEIFGEHDASVGIELTGTVQATLHDMLIRRCHIGVHLTKRNRNILLDACHIYDGRGPAIGVYFDGVNLHQAIIVGCHISYQRHAGIKIARSEVRNLQITGNDIEYNDADLEGDPDSADVWIDARDGTVREGTIASNTIQAKPSPNGANVRIEGPERDDAAGAGLWTIVGNVLQSQERNLWLRHCRAVAVSGNSFASADRHSVDIEGCRIINLGANTFDHNPDYRGTFRDGIIVRRSSAVSMTGLILEGVRAGSPDRGAAISVTDSDAVTIGHCQVLDPTARGIELDGVRGAVVEGCTVLDRRIEPSMTEAIRLRGRCSGVSIRGNVVSGGQEAIVVDEGAGVAVEGTVARSRRCGGTWTGPASVSRPTPARKKLAPRGGSLGSHAALLLLVGDLFVVLLDLGLLLIGQRLELVGVGDHIARAAAAGDRNQDQQDGSLQPRRHD